MDPLTQGIVGTTAAQTVTKHNNFFLASLVGFLAGMAPDLDVLIRSQNNPLLFLEFHRHFTHSLLFIPAGALLCSIIFYFLFTKKFGMSFKLTFIFSLIGYSTHGLLDSLTSYGTQLYWPFTNERVAFNLVSVIDPLFTIPIIIFASLAMYKKSKLYTVYALVWILIYQLVSYVQKQRAEDYIYEHALRSGHEVQSVVAKPSFGNIVVWKVIYSTQNMYHVNAIRLGLIPELYLGQPISKLNTTQDFPWLDSTSQQAKDLEKFRWFSNGYLAVDKDDENIVYDIRFSSLPNETEGLWGIKLNRDKKLDEHIEYITNRRNDSKRYQDLINMIFNKYENK